MADIIPYEHDHLWQVCDLVNHHLSATVPGWALPGEVIEAAMRRNPGEYVIDPWVVERTTLCVLDNSRVVGLAHLLRYGTGREVGDHYRGAGDISWFLSWPESREAADTLLKACQGQMSDWKVSHTKVWDNGLPVPLLGNIPDVWPHIVHIFSKAGFHSSRARGEAIFGGRLSGIPSPSPLAPVEGLICQRALRSSRGFGFSALLNDQEIGWCECVPDLTGGGLLPALRGWAELSELYVEETWRSQGVGSWLVQQAVEWLRLAGCDRIAFSVDAGDEERGAGRFYQRFGWNTLTRLQVGWSSKQ